jgi:hypothetical protein
VWYCPNLGSYHFLCFWEFFNFIYIWWSFHYFFFYFFLCFLVTYICWWCRCFIRKDATTGWWSLPISAPLFVQISRRDLLKDWLIAMWFIWFSVLRSRETEVFLCISLCINEVSPIVSP